MIESGSQDRRLIKIILYFTSVSDNVGPPTNETLFC